MEKKDKVDKGTEWWGGDAVLHGTDREAQRGQCEQKLEAPREEGDPGKERQGQVSEAHVAGV